MNQLVKTVLANTPRRRMSAAAFGAAVYAVVVVATPPHHLRDGVWALMVFAALVWGLVELGRGDRRERPMVADARSQLKLK
jgi:hypothetical protein